MKQDERASLPANISLAHESGEESLPPMPPPAIADKQPAHAAESTQAASKSWALELTILFLLAMALRCAYNYLIPHVNNFAACDAFEYINNGQALLELFKQPMAFWQTCLACLTGSGTAADLQTVKTAFAPLQDFYISGPVYPAVLALNTALFGGTVSNVHYIWQALLFGNSLVSALSCVFISLIALELFGKRDARIAGVIAALYPGFIVNSGRLYSETFACFLLTALSYLTVRGFRDGGNNLLLVFASGFIASALQLTRSVMSVLSLALVPITALQQKGLKRLVFLLPFVLGFALLALPWLGFQKLAFGGGGLVVNRVGQYNFFIGNNVDTQGWLSYPYPDGRNVESQSFTYLIKSAVEKSPSRWFRLMLDKPLRLFKFPWNDFRTPIGFVSFGWQVVFHELVVLFSVLGLALGLFLSAGGGPTKRQLCGRIFLAGLFAFHLIYNLFITVPRYNLTAIPEMIVFAAAAISLIYSLVFVEKRKEGSIFALATAALFIVLRINLLPLLVYAMPVQIAWGIEAALRTVLLLGLAAAAFVATNLLFGRRVIASALIVLTTICFVPLLVMPLRANGRYFEWQKELGLSSTPVKQVMHMPVAAAGKPCYIMLDTDGVRQFSDGLQVQVNGKTISGPVLPSMAFAENFDRFLELGPKSVQREGERMWDSLVNSTGQANLDLRQWSMIALPSALVNEALEQAKKNHEDALRFEVSVQNTNAKPIRLYGSYNTGDRERILPSVSVYSWEKVFYGVENPEGLTDTRYDIKVPAGTLDDSKNDLSEQLGLQNGVYNMALLVQPPVADGSGAVFASSQKLGSVDGIKTADGKNLPVNLEGIGSDASALWLFHLHGRCRMLNGNACPEAEIETNYKRKDGTEYSYKSAWNPKRLASSSQWKDFEFVIPIKPVVDSARATNASLNLRIVSAESPYLNVEQKFSGEAEFADLQLDVLRLPANPIGLGHQVF